MNKSQILKNNGFIYEFNNEQIIKSVKMLKNERTKGMDKNIHPYKQRGDTCAIACMMMVLEYYHIMDKANWYDERRLYRIYGSKYMDGTPFSALAYHFSKNGLTATIYHSDENLFSNDKKELDKNTFNYAMNEYKKYLERAVLKGTKVISGIDINTDFIKERMQNGNIIILAGQINKSFHAILISGYKEDKFIVCDPLYKNQQIRSADELTDFMNTGIGKWFITVKGKVN